ncbi:hypothetical protein F4777DRAFT_525812 [Nemania sp. FL0916]|nr:hypothetical protein F4777DRAFT_525812 [Nemania sp. FL0916]
MMLVNLFSFSLSPFFFLVAYLAGAIISEDLLVLQRDSVRHSTALRTPRPSPTCLAVTKRDSNCLAAPRCPPELT